jgi:hypothetical protein
MADWTKAMLSSNVLQYLGVTPAGQAASSEDDTLCQSVIDSVHEQLEKLGLAPFATSAIPEWAQWPLVKYVAMETAPAFGVTGQRLVELAAGQVSGRRELEQQTAGRVHPVRGKAQYF